MKDQRVGGQLAHIWDVKQLVWIASLEDVDDFVWNAGQPDEGTISNCMHLSPAHGFEGSDFICTFKYFPVCQQI